MTPPPPTGPSQPADSSAAAGPSLPIGPPSSHSAPGSPREPGPSAPDSGRRSWHRRAARPVMWWMLALIVVAFIHPWIPQYRWLMVHMVTLGLVTTSILIWGQHFASALLKTRLAEETRDWQVRRIWVLTASIAITMVGMLGDRPWMTGVGALGVSAVLIWYAVFLGQQIRAAIAPRFAFVPRLYLLAALLLPMGAVFGAILAFSPGEPWQGRLLLAHQIINLLGFLGLTASATLFTLWPTILRTRLRMGSVRAVQAALIIMLAGVLVAVLGALVNNALLGAGGLVLYIAGQGRILWELVVLARQSAAHHAAPPRRRVTLPLFPILSIGAGTIWFLLSTVSLLVMWLLNVGGPNGAAVSSPLNFSLLADELARLTVPFVVGFGLQLLLGAMSYLMPTVMGGGPRAVQASLAEMSRFAVLRVVTLNLALALFAAASVNLAVGRGLFGMLTLGTMQAEQFGSLSRILVSLLGFASLAVFIVLLVRMVRVNVRERRAAVGSAAAAPSSPSGLEAPALPMDRRHLTAALVGTAGVLGVNAFGHAFSSAGSAPGAAGTGSATGSGTDSSAAAASQVQPTGETTTAEIHMLDTMRFSPDVVEVPAGNRLVIELINDDPTMVHDLVLASGATSGRVQPGQSTTLDAGVITGPLDGWCSIVGHRSMGMEMRVNALGMPTAATGDGTGSGAGTGGAGSASGTEADPLARVTSDFAATPAAAVRDARLPARAPASMTLTVTEADREIAPGVMMQALTFNGQVMGPIIRTELGQELTVELVNRGSMGHSIDFHAGTVSPTRYMREIKPGDSLTYPLVTEHAGIWLYHCSSMPMTVHLSAGMFGALIVPPRDLRPVAKEWVLVQSDHYLAPAGADAGNDGAVRGPMRHGAHAHAHRSPHATAQATAADTSAAHAISPEKIHAERPDFTVFNGHATQYVHQPLTATVGERVRIWVLAAGPTRALSFHVVGAVFDTVFKEGEYQLRPDNPHGGGAQALDLSAAQGGFVEMVFREPGTYTAVNHAFADMERGARALITVTD